MGFDPRNETINAVEAWLGSLPGHGWYDVRRPLRFCTQNLADILPLTSIWAGLATNPCPYYAKNTPALCYGATRHGTPFRLNLPMLATLVTTGILGPTWERQEASRSARSPRTSRAVPEGQIFFFDKRATLPAVLTKALRRTASLDLGEDEVPLCPRRAHQRRDRPYEGAGTARRLAELQGVPSTFRIRRKALWRALELGRGSTARAAHY